MLGVDEANRRISLGLKQTEPNPWESSRSNHPVGSRVNGKVKSITDFGVFVEIEAGIDGLVHISDLSWTKKVRHPSELYKKGDEVEAVVLGIDVENERISLGIKQLTADPWSTVAQRYPLNTRVNGKVSSVADFGVFVELEEGIEGLIHISQLSTERVDKPSSLFKVGRRGRGAGRAGRQPRSAGSGSRSRRSSSTKSARRCRPTSSASTRRRASRSKTSSTKSSGSIATRAAAPSAAAKDATVRRASRPPSARRTE